MSRYSVEFVPSVDKALQRLPVKDQKRIVPAAESLADDPRPVRSTRLAGTENVWRIRVGDFRILYEVHDARLVVLVVRVGNRKDVCRD